MISSDEPKQIAFVLYPGLTALDLVGPLQVFAALSQFTPAIGTTVVAQHLAPMETDTPLKLLADRTFEEVPAPAVIIVPGGTAPTVRAMTNTKIREYLRAAAESAEIVGSVCSGALILGAAGLLEGRRATTHWAGHRHLQKLGATYVAQRWVEDGKFITSAGVSAGIDMALYLAARLTSVELARQAQLFIEYDPQPPFGGLDWANIDKDMMAPVVDGWLTEELAGDPALLARMTRQSAIGVTPDHTSQ